MYIYISVCRRIRSYHRAKSTVLIYIYMYIHIYTHTPVCIHKYICMYLYIYIYIYRHFRRFHRGEWSIFRIARCIYVNIHIYTHTHRIHMYICMYIYIHVYRHFRRYHRAKWTHFSMYICKHTHTHTHTHVYTCIYMHVCTYIYVYRHFRRYHRAKSTAFSRCPMRGKRVTFFFCPLFCIACLILCVCAVTHPKKWLIVYLWCMYMYTYVCILGSGGPLFSSDCIASGREGLVPRVCAALR